MRRIVLSLVFVMFASVASAQSPVRAAAPNPPVPMTGEARVGWVVDGNASPRSLLAGFVVAGWNTAVDSPPEWQRTWNGFGKRYMAREGNVAVSNGIEAGVGALWDEDPRYFRAAPGSTFMARIGHAVRDAVVARRHDHAIPAYARYTANVGTVFIAESWLPPSASTAGNRTLRIGSALGGRALANLWQEFWPDVRTRLHR
ncbi:MAG TPA: hypothetical protein VG871_04635 [Vicinamibacterales bacterium]|nr:hypothetical protein [Vicinamibacterales bacterium]